MQLKSFLVLSVLSIGALAGCNKTDRSTASRTEAPTTAAVPDSNQAMQASTSPDYQTGVSTNNAAVRPNTADDLHKDNKNSAQTTTSSHPR